MVLLLIPQGFYFQIPEGTEKDGNILWLPFPQSRLWSSPRLPLPVVTFQTGIHKAVMTKNKLFHH